MAIIYSPQQKRFFDLMKKILNFTLTKEEEEMFVFHYKKSNCRLIRERAKEINLFLKEIPGTSAFVRKRESGRRIKHKEQALRKKVLKRYIEATGHRIYRNAQLKDWKAISVSN